MSGLSRKCRTCCRKQQNKIQPANRKSKREFFRRENTRCTFSSRRHLCFRLGRPAAQSPTLPGRLHIPFRRQPANTSRRPSFHTGPTILNQPTPFLPAWPADALYPFPPLFNIYKASSSHQVSLPTILPKSTNNHLPQTSSRRISVIFPDITPHYFTHLPFSIFPFSISRPTSSRPSSFRTSNSNLISLFPNALHFFRPAAASPTRRPNAKRSFARGCSLQGCRWCGRGARVSFFLFFLLLSFLSSFPSPWRRGCAATPSFFFLFFFLFLFFLSFCFFAFIFAFFFLLFFLFIFILIFYSCFSLFSLFAFSFFLLLFLSLFFGFLFLFLLFFLVFIFASPFLFCLSFCFTFLPSSLQSLSSLSNRSPAIHFFSSAANLSHSIQSLPAAAKKKKKYRQKNPWGLNGLPGANGRREERQREGMEF